jgi:hypothetical protein
MIRRIVLVAALAALVLAVPACDTISAEDLAAFRADTTATIGAVEEANLDALAKLTAAMEKAEADRLAALESIAEIEASIVDRDPTPEEAAAIARLTAAAASAEALAEENRKVAAIARETAEIAKTGRETVAATIRPDGTVDLSGLAPVATTIGGAFGGPAGAALGGSILVAVGAIADALNSRRKRRNDADALAKTKARNEAALGTLAAIVDGIDRFAEKSEDGAAPLKNEIKAAKNRRVATHVPTPIA